MVDKQDATALADRWPLGCHSPNSCSSHGRCMYVDCKHNGKDIAALATAFTPDPRRAPASVSTPAQDAVALADELDRRKSYVMSAGLFESAGIMADAAAFLRATSQTPDAVREALTKIVSIALAGQSPLPHHLVCHCTICEMRRIAEAALQQSPATNNATIKTWQEDH